MLFSPVNLPYWIFLVAGIALFLFVIVSGGGDDDLDADGDLDFDADTDLDADLDADLEVDGDLDVDADMDADAGGGFWGADGEGLSPLQVLAWFGVGKTPLLLLLAMDLTLWGFIGWVLNVALGDVLNTPPVGWVALGVFAGSLVFSLFVGSVLSRPIGQVFAAFGEDTSSDRLVGCLGTVTSAFVPFEESGKIGQVDVKDSAANLVTISAKLPNWATITLRRGARVVVIERQGGYYWVIAQNSPDQDRWLSSGRSP